MGDDHAVTRKILADLVHHPNAGAVLVLGLGCENNTVDEFKTELGDFDGERVRFLATQSVPDEITEGRRILSDLVTFAGKFQRERVPASELIIGLKCGGSDGFSGLTANPLVGRVCDTITDFGGTAILTEVPEMFGAEQLLMGRCATRELFNQTVLLINKYKNYFRTHNQVVYENPSPGNKDGGISTLEDKSLGCVQKGGQATIQGVLSYGDRVANSGLQLLEGPGNDMVSTTALTAAGAHVILFTTGRGTPLGAPVPTLKISSNSELAAYKSGWIDFDAGRMLTQDSDALLQELMDLIYAVASGRQHTKNEENDYREIAIFKDGVIL
jgi:altronate hydrolase